MTECDQQHVDDRQLINAGHRYAVSLTHNQHEAEDLLQQACLKILRSRGSLVGKSYLFTTIRNLFFDTVRKQSRHFLESTAPASIPDGVSDHVASIQQKTDLGQMLSSLRPEEREVLYLNCAEEYTAEEIGALSSQPRGTVLSLLARAKKKLNQKYDRSEVMDTK